MFFLPSFGGGSLISSGDADLYSVIRVISTFNAAGLESYGRRMAETFDLHWPGEVGMTVYAEGWWETIGRAGLMNLEKVSPWLSAFKERHANRTFKDYRWDAVRFAHKVAAVCYAATCHSDRQDCDWLIWMDGDVITHAPVTEHALSEMLPRGDEWISWLDRARMYPETGLFVLNCRHPRHHEMILRLQTMYAADCLFKLKEFHDGFVIQHVVKESGIAAKSLSGDARRTSHPLVNGPLGAFLDHAKGQRKKAGRTPKAELVAPRAEAYWR